MYAVCIAGVRGAFDINFRVNEVGEFIAACVRMRENSSL